jgi:hypothetical protein
MKRAFLSLALAAAGWAAAAAVDAALRRAGWGL